MILVRAMSVVPCPCPVFPGTQRACLAQWIAVHGTGTSSLYIQYKRQSVPAFTAYSHIKITTVASIIANLFISYIILAGTKPFGLIGTLSSLYCTGFWALMKLRAAHAVKWYVCNFK